MKSLIEKLMGNRPVLTDGAWGTILQAKGLPSGELPDHWNLTHPHEVRSIAKEYADAGSQIVLTNTFGASRINLKRYGLADHTIEINRQGAALSKQAVNGSAVVFASIGPSGKMLVTGEVTESELQHAFEEQAAALAEGGADGIVIETMSDLTEATIAFQAALHTNLPVVVCMVYDSGKKKDRTMMGVTPEQAAQTLSQKGADVIGANCGQGIEHFVDLCRRLHDACDLPVWIKANAGTPKMIDGKLVFQTTATQFAQYLHPLVEAGASFTGGCCGTNPEFINALKQAKDHL
jgi:methionine synthase I (cobalamin-dependent)